MPARSLSVVLALLALAGLSAAQLSVTPASRALVLAPGDSAKVTIDTGGCDPSWTAASADADVASVSPNAYTNGGKRKFTVTAGEGASAGDTITVTVDLADGECLAESSVVFTVYVVGASPKTLVKQFAKGLAEEDVTGTKPRLKTLKTALKVLEKVLKSKYKELLAEQKAGTLALNESIPAPPGGSVLRDHEIALSNALDFEFILADGVWKAWFLTAGGSAADGNDLLSLHGYLSADRDVVATVTPGDLLRGSGGTWDDVTDSSWAQALTTLGRAQNEAQKFHAKLQKASALGAHIHSRALPPLDISPLLDGPSQLGFLPQISPALDGRPQLLMLRASNHYADGNDNGRLYMLGRGRALSTLDVTMQRLASGLPTGDPVEREVELVFDTLWRLVEPPTSEAANLAPGSWRVTISDGTREVTEVIDIPVN